MRPRREAIQRALGESAVHFMPFPATSIHASTTLAAWSHADHFSLLYTCPSSHDATPLFSTQSSAFSNLALAEKLPSQVHELAARFTIPDELEHHRSNQRSGFDVIQLEAAVASTDIRMRFRAHRARGQENSTARRAAPTTLRHSSSIQVSPQKCYTPARMGRAGQGTPEREAGEWLPQERARFGEGAKERRVPREPLLGQKSALVQQKVVDFSWREIHGVSLSAPVGRWAARLLTGIPAPTCPPAM